MEISASGLAGAGGRDEVLELFDAGVGAGDGVGEVRGGGGGEGVAVTGLRCEPQPASNSKEPASAATWSGFAP